jgi:hypothetical protein
MSNAYVGTIYIWEGDTSALVTSDSDQPLVGKFEVWCKERVTRKGTKYLGGPIQAGGADGAKPSMHVGNWIDTQHGRRRVCTLYLDGSQGVKFWATFADDGDGNLRMNAYESDTDRTKRYADKHADIGHQLDASGNIDRKGSPGRLKAVADRAGGGAPITDDDIPFAC